MVKMLSPAFPPRRPSGLVRYALAALFIITLFYFVGRTPHREVPSSYVHNEVKPKPDQHAESSAGETTTGAGAGSSIEAGESTSGSDGSSSSSSSSHPETSSDSTSAKRPSPLNLPTGNHPIDKLIREGQATYQALIDKQSYTLESAAEAYRERRGRHPPPGFREWFEFAQDRNAVVVEDFFDQIYHDLDPFWGLDAAVIRKEAWDFEMTINIRGGRASARSDWFWTQIWLDMIRTIEHLLPDMDIALNAMDEPRLVVPWEDVSGYMKKGEKARTAMPKPKEVIQTYQELPPPGEGDADVDTRSKDWEKTKPYWAVARRGCPPTSAARTTDLQKTFATSPTITMDQAKPHLQDGYVANFTLSSDFCHQPDLQGLEGIFIEPLSTSATKVLFPMFGGSKLAVNNEILLPAPMYWKEEARFTGGDAKGPEWAKKKDGIIWRGVATGGRNKQSNWKGFQRHRFVSMNNGSRLARAEDGTEAPINFVLPDEKLYPLAARKDKITTESHLGEWVSSFADVAFVDLMCSPWMDKGQCNYTGPYFDVVPGVKMADQFDFKFLPDIDGNSFSGRYLGFLRSTSVPVKATLWREWHDSRLVAWKHFIPMDSRFGDYYGIMEYFLGYAAGELSGHDKEAERIAMEGKEWAERVLRKEDMQIYVLRLLLEYARLSDERRETMGWVDDLL